MRFEGELASATAEERAGMTTEQPALGITYQLNFEPTQLALNDFNGDRQMDILVRGRNGGEIALLLGNGKGTFERTPDAARLLKEFAARNRGGVHLSLASESRTLGSQGCGLALAGKQRVTSCSIIRGELRDVNGDGLKDVLLDQAPGQVSTWLRAAAGGKFYVMKAGNSVQPRKEQAINVTQADIDGNGLEDLAFADEAHNEVVFLLATQPGAFVKAAVPIGERPSAIGLADLNHNGRADLVVISRAKKSITVLLSL